MRYWWVNQNGTYRHELGGQYLWSPKRKSNGHRNPYYETMREVAPGDLVFSFVDTRIRAIGIARSYSYESPKPTEFGTTGSYWGQIGWKIEVAFRLLNNRIRPKDHIQQLRALLPNKYSPLDQDGDGSQSIYLTEVSELFANELLTLIGQEVSDIKAVAREVSQNDRSTPAPEPTLEEWEHRVEADIKSDTSIPDTERKALTDARIGQGKFRSRVREIEHACRITKVDRPQHLIASHIKPWRDSTNEERLNGENGLLLTPTIDHLFDKGFISFENNGRLIISPVADQTSLQRMGITPATAVNVGTFTEGQRKFLEYHRDDVLKMARVKT